MSACPHTEQFLLEQLSRHPASQLQDLRKALYQSAFGCGHLVEDPSAAADWIRREAAESASADQEVERLDGPWSRVPLGMLADGLTPETLAAAFAASAAIPGEDTHGLEQRLETLLALIRDRKLPFSLSDAEAEINAWRAAGYPACHHSDAYRAAYRPAYRVLHKRYVRLLPLLAAIDHALKARWQTCWPGFTRTVRYSTPMISFSGRSSGRRRATPSPAAIWTGSGWKPRF